MKYLPLALLLVAAPASAQSLKLPTTVFLASAAVDWSSTAYCLHTHPTCYETNPLINWAAPAGDGVMLSVSVATDVATAYAVHRFVGRNHPKVARVTLYALSALRVYAAAQNVRTMQRGH
jgi:hypothetical protein